MANLWRSHWFFHSSCFWSLPWSNSDGVIFLSLNKRAFAARLVDASQTCIYHCLLTSCHFYPLVYHILSTKFAVVSLKRQAVLNSDEFESLFCDLFWAMVPCRLCLSFSSVSYLSPSRSGSNQHSMYFQTTDYCHPDVILCICSGLLPAAWSVPLLLHQPYSVYGKTNLVFLLTPILNFPRTISRF